jgi:CubicO group peptidase (beta-lactamase class C family)
MAAETSSIAVSDEPAQLDLINVATLDAIVQQVPQAPAVTPSQWLTQHKPSSSAAKTATPAKTAPFVGVAILMQGDRMLWRYGYHPDMALSGQQQFLSGSIAKQMTATLVLQAQQQGLLQLEQPVARYLPQPQRARYGNITILQLLQHTSGIEKPGSVPGATFAYSNQGYQLLGEMLGYIYAEPFSQQLNRLLKRCQMADSFAPDADHPVTAASQLVPALNWQQGQWQPVLPDALPLSLVPAGLVVTSAQDLLRWQQCLHQTELLPSALHQRMVTPGPQRPHRWGSVDAPIFYGMGVQIQQHGGLQEWSHGGFLPGYAVTLLYYPRPALGNGERQDLQLVIWQPYTGDPADLGQTLWVHDALRQALRAQL